jgi:hypothetical protein
MAAQGNIQIGSISSSAGADWGVSSGSDRARISVDSQDSGEGGNIQLQTRSLNLDQQAAISAETISNTGGNILTFVQDLHLRLP